MSGMWKSQGRLITPKKPKVLGHSIETKKGGVYLVPKSRKNKLLWEMAKYIGPVPVDAEDNSVPEDDLKYAELVDAPAQQEDEIKPE